MSLKKEGKMPGKPREKMSIEDRAKQFAPFSALSGLDEALRRKEWEVEAESTKENNRVLLQE